MASPGRHSPRCVSPISPPDLYNGRPVSAYRVSKSNSMLHLLMPFAAIRSQKVCTSVRNSDNASDNSRLTGVCTCDTCVIYRANRRSVHAILDLFHAVNGPTDARCLCLPLRLSFVLSLLCRIQGGVLPLCTSAAILAFSVTYPHTLTIVAVTSASPASPPNRTRVGLAPSKPGIIELTRSVTL